MNHYVVSVASAGNGDTNPFLIIKDTSLNGNNIETQSSNIKLFYQRIRKNSVLKWIQKKIRVKIWQMNINIFFIQTLQELKDLCFGLFKS